MVERIVGACEGLGHHIISVLNVVTVSNLVITLSNLICSPFDFVILILAGTSNAP